MPDRPVTPEQTIQRLRDRGPYMAWIASDGHTSYGTDNESWGALLDVAQAALHHEHTESAERVLTLPVEGCELCAALARLAGEAPGD